MSKDQNSKKLALLLCCFAIAFAFRDSILETYTNRANQNWSLLHIHCWNITGWLLWLPFVPLCWTISQKIHSSKRSLLWLIPVSVIASIVQAQIHYSFDWLLFPLEMSFPHHLSFSRAAWGIVVSSIILIFCHRLLLERRLAETESREETIQQILRKTELKTISLSLDSGTLFSRLRRASDLIKQDVERADLFITNIADYLRKRLRASSNPFHSLAEEAELVRCLLDMKETAGERAVKVQWDFGPGTEQMRVPSFCLERVIASFENEMEITVSAVSGPALTIVIQPIAGTLSSLMEGMGTWTMNPEEGFIRIVFPQPESQVNDSFSIPTERPDAKKIKLLHFARRSSSTLILCLLIWFLIGLVSSIGTILDQRFRYIGGRIQWEPTFRLFLSWILVGLYCPVILWLQRKFPVQRMKNLSVHIIGCITLWFFVSVLLNAYMKDWNLAAIDYGRVTRVGLAGGFKMDVYFAAVVVLAMAGSWRSTARKELETIKTESLLFQAQLEALKLQLHPHFLFNALNSIAELIHQDPARARKMIEQLENLLRVTLDASSIQQIVLQKELEILNYYLDMQKTRFGKRLTLDFRIDPHTLHCLVPNLLLQPIVENCVHHGLSSSSMDGGMIQITSERKKGRVRFVIKDNGMGLIEKEPGKEGIGLATTRARLDQLYGTQYSFDLKNDPNGGLLVSLEIPAQIVSV